ncbi:MAG: hypothetical protein ABIH00_05765 [Armatimonadota bacterium]
MKTEVKLKVKELKDFNIKVDGDVFCTFKTKYDLKEVENMSNSELYWNIFQSTGSPLAYLLYKEEASSS